MIYRIYYSFTIQEDLFNLINTYVDKVLYGKYKGETLFNYDNLEIDEIEELAVDAINWLESEQLPKVNLYNKNTGAPEEWSQLYYMMLSCVIFNRPTKLDAELKDMKMWELSIETLKKVAELTIEVLSDYADRIRKPTEEELNQVLETGYRKIDYIR